ncbi:MAG: 3'-5' exoribonuclease YhaM family protein [Eubacteriaceae bacterium]
MKDLEIKGFKFNETIEGFLFIKHIEYRKAKNDSVYIDMTLSDTFGDEVNAKIWNAKEIDSSIYKAGIVVKVSGMIQKYNNKTQLIINKIRTTKDNDEVNIEDYIESAPIDSKKMLVEIKECIKLFENEELKKLTLTLLENKEQKLIYYPAAKTHHHNVKGGLLHHILTMLRVGQSISDNYDFINKDLLYCGVIVHDLAKVDEILSNEIGLVEDYTKEGKLLGHIIQGINEIDRVADELKIDHELKILVQHMILSHHYHPEYGSPKKPLIPEAELLHYLDIMDARMYAMNKTLCKVKEGEFAERNISLEGRSMYKSDINSLGDLTK